jgi:hypothetical protein
MRQLIISAKAAIVVQAVGQLMDGEAAAMGMGHGAIC